MAGGGCLDLSATVSEKLGLERDSITGTWDFAHQLQIIWNNSLSQHETVEELITLIFSSMDYYRMGQAGTIFRTRAAELAHLVHEEEADN